MAKKSVSQKDYKRMLAARQQRVGGRFGTLKPEYTSSSTPATQMPANAPSMEAETAEQVNFLQAIIEMRKKMGVETSALEEYVVGTASQMGVRSIVEQFIKENREKFDQEDPAGAAAFELMEETVVLSEQSLKASRDEAKAIYAKLRFIKGLAEKTQGKQSQIAKKLEEIIAPVELQLKKRTSFSEMLREKAEDFKRTIPERIAARIPVIGGFLSQALREKRTQEEDLERYTGLLQEQISRKGRVSGGLDIRGTGSRGRMSSGAATLAALGGSTAQKIFGMEPNKGVTSTLGAIYKDIHAIRSLLEENIKPESDIKELLSRESEFEGRSSLAKKAKSGLIQAMIRPFMGGAATAAGEVAGGAAAGGGGGLASNIAAGAASSYVGARVAASGGFARTLGRGVGRVGNLFSRMGGTLSGWWGSLKGLGSSALESLSKLSPVAQLSRVVSPYAGGVAKFVMSAPVLSSIISGIISGLDIKSILNDDSIPPEQKKERIGKELMRLLGGMGGAALGTWLGGAGGAALGSVVPVLGTAAGGWVGSLIGAMGGEWVGKNLLGIIGDSIGGREIYDIAASIPGIGSMIKVDDNKSTATAGAEGTTQSMTATGETRGVVSTPPTPNTTVGRQYAQMTAEQKVLTDAKQASSAAVWANSGTKQTTNASVNTRISNVTNNFNDDLRIRNNEPTQKQMQAFSIVL